MLKKILILLFLLMMSAQGASQSTPLVLTEFPVAIGHPDSAVWIKWTGISMDSATICFSRKPGGSVPANYEGRITGKNIVFTDKNMPERGIKFTPSKSAGMETGIYYLMVAVSDSVYSNEIKFIVKTTDASVMLSPIGTKITDVTPAFKWTPVSDVPYYHVIVTDEKIVVGENNKIEGLSVIWQAITSGTEIIYGAPDPSGTITATPPPLSPGSNYSWFVLNNYGNNAALSVFDLKIPSTFSLNIQDTLKAPKLVSPAVGDTLSYTEFSDANPFKLTWTNLDSRANTYKVYLYAQSEDTLLNAQIAVWDGEVTAGTFANKTNGEITIDAKNVLTTNMYAWKVIAVDSKGYARSSTSGKFKYKGRSGGILARTYEQIKTSGGTIEQKVGLTELKVEVLDGSMEKPLLNYTDQNGYLYRSRPIGTYRITAVKDGYRTVSKTVTVTEGDTSKITFYLERPDASVYGTVSDADSKPVATAKITAVSTFGDSAFTETDPSGNFVVNCGKGDWDISAYKSGFISPLPVRTTVDYAESRSLSAPITLTKNSFILSGVITNETGAPLVAARVVVKDENGTVVGELPSTSSRGLYNFSLNSGKYTLSASKTGFTMYTESFLFTSSSQKNIVLTAGAAQIKGSIYGKNWSYEGKPTTAAIRGLTITAFTAAGKEAASAVTDSWGAFTLSLPGDQADYLLKYRASGFIADSSWMRGVGSKTTYLFADTLNGLANMYGTVRISDSTAAKADVQVSLSDPVTGNIAAFGKSDNAGALEIYSIPDGEYTVKAAGNGYFADTIYLKLFDGTSVVSSTVSVKDGRLVSGNSAVQRVDAAVRKGEGSVQWSVHAPASMGTASIKVVSPFVVKAASGDTLRELGLGDYRVEADAQDLRVVDCSKHMTSIVDNGVLKSDTISLPFWHIVKDSLQMAGNTVSFTAEVDVSVYTAKNTPTAADIYYRAYGSSDFIKTAGTAESDGSCSFQISGIKSGNWLEYYFNIKTASGDEFGYSKELYRTFIKPDPAVITRLELLPAADSTGFILPLNGEIRLELRGYYGDKFTPIDSLPSNGVTWKTSGAVTVVPVKGTASAVVTASRSDTGTVTAVFSSGTLYSFAKGADSAVTVKMRVTDGTLDSLKVYRIKSADESPYILNGGKAQFAVSAFDTKGKRVTVSPKWTISPDSAGTISADGLFTPAAGFVGRVQASASVNDTIRDQYRESEAENFGILSAYSVESRSDSLKLNDFSGMKIFFPESSVTGTPFIFSADHIESKNSVEKTVPQEGVSLISKMYEIKKISGKLRADSTAGLLGQVSRLSKITGSIEIPKNYRQFADESGSRFTLGIWNADSLKWMNLWDLKKSKSRADTADTSVFLKSVAWNRTDTAIQFTVGDSLNSALKGMRLAVLFNEKGNVQGEFEVSPNPFSPYVAPVNDYAFLPGMSADVKGTCLKIVPMSSTTGNNPNVTVNIYTANRTLVWETQLNSTIPGKEYYLFWDGKTRRGRSDSGKTVSVQENTPIQPEGDEMCRNGRYFAIVTIDDGKEKKRFTKEIILFK